jgi:tetratricopeptide (TPR) repeat protein
VSNLYVNIYQQPRWFAEGFARYLESLRYDNTTGAVEIGRPPRDYEHLRYTGLASIDEVWSWDEAEDLGPSRTEQLYQTSWAIVHWLFDECKEDVEHFEDALDRGSNAQEAWNAIFELDEPAMAMVVRKYVAAHRHRLTKATVAPLKVTMQSRPLGHGDVLAFRAMLQMMMRSERSDQESKDLALANIYAALRLEPANFWANLVNLAYFEQLPVSIDIAHRALETQKDNWLAWAYYADVIGAMQGPVAERRAAANRAVELAPTAGMALASASRAEGELGNWNVALNLAAQALRSHSWSTTAIPAYASALAHWSQCDHAQRVVEGFRKRHMGNSPRLVRATAAEVDAVCDAQ